MSVVNRRIAGGVGGQGSSAAEDGGSGGGGGGYDGGGGGGGGGAGGSTGPAGVTSYAAAAPTEGQTDGASGSITITYDPATDSCPSTPTAATATPVETVIRFTG